MSGQHPLRGGAGRSSVDTHTNPFHIEDSETDSEENHVLSPTPPPASLSPLVERPAFLLGLQSAESGVSNDARDEDDVPLGSPRPMGSQIAPLSVAGSQATLRSPRAPHQMFKSSATTLQNPQDESEPPALYLPALISPSLFLPIPNTDQLAVLLNKHVPPELRPVRDLSGAWEHEDYHTLVMTNSWRALARMARDRLISSSADDSTLIFELWYLRLNSLARLRLFNQASTECSNLFHVISNVQPALVRQYLLESIVPFELEVMRARTRCWNNDPYGYLDELSLLLQRCKKMTRRAENRLDIEMWKERAVRIGLIIASQLLEMQDHTAAATILRPLCQTTPSNSPSPATLSAVARIYLDVGDLNSAAELFRKAEADPSCDVTAKQFNRALQASARLDWPVAVENLKSILEREPENAVVANNLSVALMSMGHLEQAIHYLEVVLQSSPSLVGSTEPFIFNLATLYELRTANSMDKKRELLIEIAKWAGDGLRANCLKLPLT